jgi:Mn2+/Fe2+ NRAMP family transporter
LAAWSTDGWILILAALAFAILYSGTYRVIERVLIALVALMSLVFLLTAILASPPSIDVLHGVVVPSLPLDSMPTVVGLIGTTVVPYNLFLHANAVQAKWSGDVPADEALAESRWDTILAVSVGGLITAAIVTTAAAAFFGRGGFPGLHSVAAQLEPALGGPLARIAFGAGLFAAGFTSALTAPLAAAFAISGVLGLRGGLRSRPFRLIWIVVLASGTVAALASGASPAETIQAAQVFNGLLLPIVAVFLLVAVNRRDLMGSHRNGWLANLLGILVVAIAAGLGARGIWLGLRPFWQALTASPA